VPSATRFLHPRPFSPAAHCVVNKTTAELDALNWSRYESTKADIMALWWNLYTVDYSIQFGAGSAQTGTTIAMRVNNSGGTVFDYEALSAGTPIERMCAAYDQLSQAGISTCSASSAGLVDGFSETTYFFLWLKRVYYNTTNAAFALQIGLRCEGGPSGEVFISSADAADANGGSVTLFGSSAYAGTVASGADDVTISISNPAYYTY